MEEVKPLSVEDLEQLKEYFRLKKINDEKRKPEPQGDYQWDGGWSINGGYGEYQGLRLKGKLIGGMFQGESSWAGQYHAFDEHGGVYSEASIPPVPHLKPKDI